MPRRLQVSTVVLLFLSLVAAPAAAVDILNLRLLLPQNTAQFIHCYMRPYAVAVDGQENVYVAEGYNACIMKFDAAGQFLSKFGNAIRLSGQSGAGRLVHGSAHDGYAVETSPNPFS